MLHPKGDYCPKRRISEFDPAQEKEAGFRGRHRSSESPEGQHKSEIANRQSEIVSAQTLLTLQRHFALNAPVYLLIRA